MKILQIGANNLMAALASRGWMFDLVLFDSLTAARSLLVHANQTDATNAKKTIAEVIAMPAYVAHFKNIRLKYVAGAKNTAAGALAINDAMSSLTDAIAVKDATVAAWVLRFSAAGTTNGATLSQTTSKFDAYLGGAVGGANDALTLQGGNVVVKDQKIRVAEFGFSLAGV